jgi:hypothetical protein
MRLVLCLMLVGCATQKEAQQVVMPEAPTPLSHHLEVDTARLPRGAGSDVWTVAGLVERHLAVEGLVHPGKKEQDTQVLVAELPTPGYALRARISPRPEQFCHVEIDLVDTRDGSHVEKAPWWAIHALDQVQRGLDTLQPPRRPAINETRFADLHAQAAELAQQGVDPPLTLEQYVHVPTRIESQAPTEYWAPPASQNGPSQLLPQKR